MATRFFDLSQRGKLVFTGSQALWFLDQLVTNRVEDLPAGKGAEALLLTPKGRITALLRILSTQGAVLADLDGDARSLAEFFQGRVFTTDVSIKEVSEEFSIFRLISRGAGEIVSTVTKLPDLPVDEHDVVAFEGGYVVRVIWPPEGFDIWTHRDRAGEVFEDLKKAGVVEMDDDDYDSLRVAEGIPLYGVDFDETYLPQEAALERVVHFDKGCYLGQESVAMAQRGSVKRRIQHLRFHGRPVFGKMRPQDGEGLDDVGRVTSIAHSEFGIGTVKTSVGSDSRVEVVVEDGHIEDVYLDNDYVVAEVRELPNTNYGPSAPSARELRERLQ